MKKRIVIAVSLVLMVCILYGVMFAAEFAQQKESIIRLHVVGASDSALDQNVKLLVRDAVLAELSQDLEACENVDAAGRCITEKLPCLEQTAEAVLKENGMDTEVTVSFREEAFPTRHYETFSLPAGIYRALRIEIGKAEGRNWWCVIFPSFCYGGVADEFDDAAACAGFSQPLTQTLAREDGCQVRFLLLDFIGRLENFFHFR